MKKRILIIVLFFLMTYFLTPNTIAYSQEFLKTYSNFKFNYSFKYPADWLIDETLSFSIDGGVRIYKGNIYGTIFIDGDGAEVYISHRKNVEGFTLENWINYLKRPTDFEEVLYIDGIKAIKLIGKFYIPSGTFNPIEDSIEIRIFFIYNNMRFEITGSTIGPNYKEYANNLIEILSTFKFSNN